MVRKRYTYEGHLVWKINTMQRCNMSIMMFKFSPSFMVSSITFAIFRDAHKNVPQKCNIAPINNLTDLLHTLEQQVARKKMSLDMSINVLKRRIHPTRLFFPKNLWFCLDILRLCLGVFGDDAWSRKPHEWGACYIKLYPTDQLNCVFCNSSTWACIVLGYKSSQCPSQILFYQMKHSSSPFSLAMNRRPTPSRLMIISTSFKVFS